MFAAGCSSLPAPDVYVIDDDSVASITQVVGSRRLAEASEDVLTDENGMKSLVYRYTNVKSPQEDLIKYVEYLRGNGFVSLMEADLTQMPGLLQLGAPSTASSRAFIITIAYYDSGYDVQVDQAAGEINVY